MIDRVANLLIEHRRSAFGFGMLIILLCCAGLPRVHVDNDYRAFFNDSNGYLETSDWLNDRLGYSKDIASLVYEPADGDVFSAVSIMQVDEITALAADLPYVVRAESWIDQSKMVVGPDERAFSASLLAGLNVFEADDQNVLRGDVDAMATVSGRYISDAGDSTIIALLLDMDSSDPDRLKKLEDVFVGVEALERQLQQIAQGDSLTLVGASLFDYQAHHVLRNDVRVLMPIALTLIFFVTWFLFQSLKFAAINLLLIGLPTLATAGLMATLGVSFSALAVSGLLLVGTLAVADILHVSATYFMARAEGQSAEHAMRRALRMNVWAIFATSLTTALGQIALLFSASPPIQIMGLTVIIGVWLALLIALLTLPMILIPMREAQSPRLSVLSTWMGKVGLFGAHHSRAVLGGSILALGLSAYAVSQSELSDSLGGWFSEETEFRRGMDAVSNGYVGSDSLTLAIEATLADKVSVGRYPNESSNAVVDAYTKIQTSLESAGGPGKWLTPVTAVQLTQQRLVDSPGSSSFLAPADAELSGVFSAEDVARSGLMTPLSLGSRDYTLWRFDPTSTSSFDVLAAAGSIEAAANVSAGDRNARLGGLSVAFADLSVQNFKSVVTSSLFAIGLISVTMFFVLGSARLGVAAILPNIVPILVALGGWAFLVEHINLAVATVFSVAMGLVVDDTVHILSKYKLYRNEGYTVDKAIEHGIRSAGPGLVTTTLVISCGFFLLATSDFLLTAQKAFLVAVTMVVALVFDIIALPAMIKLVDRDEPIVEGNKNETA